ncbi:hypothetical protein AVEN_197078-1 [Araneus ventricosus]|uniref:Uncharacterized protein n=1 Tax=Araneus ventricosus TaxID=182803 RepID=A0A4Y2NCG0_ARAVE|nr:hypothetical protein AVEN_136407-1 [Araneus ventricosus]GBN36924.1 hypothetical protein AVEN_213701-1 [Araneus ventricosus]GBN36974.1 hypothetical protein AVEN_197078-1 [Araneus ventricosus]
MSRCNRLSSSAEKIDTTLYEDLEFYPKSPAPRKVEREENSQILDWKPTCGSGLFIWKGSEMAEKRIGLWSSIISLSDRR